MSNPPRKKGTGFETERVNAWLADRRVARRMPPGSLYDNHIEPGRPGLDGVVEALTVRADRGEAMTLITHEDFRRLANFAKIEVHEECKRYSRISLTTIYRKKFPR